MKKVAAGESKLQFSNTILHNSHSSLRAAVSYLLRKKKMLHADYLHSGSSNFLLKIDVGHFRSSFRELNKRSRFLSEVYQAVTQSSNMFSNHCSQCWQNCITDFSAFTARVLTVWARDEELFAFILIFRSYRPRIWKTSLLLYWYIFFFIFKVKLACPMVIGRS